MVKPPRIRHSKSGREPVTIDLDAGDVSRIQPDDSGERGGTPADAAPELESGGPAGPAVPESDKVADSVFGRDSAGASQPSNQEKQKASPTPDAEDEPQAGSRSGSGALLGGLVGGLIVLAGVGGLSYAGLLTPLRQADNGAEKQLQGEIDTLRSELAALRDNAGASDALRSAVEAGQSRVEAMSVLVEEMRAELSQLHAAGAAGGSSEAAIALETRLAGLERAVAALPASSGADGEALRAEIGQLGDSVRRAGDAASAVMRRVDDIESKLNALSGQVEQMATRPDAALAVAASALKAAMDRGTPFSAELETFASLAPDNPDIPALREMAGQGVPTQSAIAAEVDAVAVRMIRAGQPENQQAGLLDQLWSSAASLVTVRPVGQVEGNDVPSIVARMEAALLAGNYEAAIAEYESLPANAKAAGVDFIGKVRARFSADQLADRVLAAALRA